MEQWNHGIGVWNDPEQYDVKDAPWKRALQFAQEYHIRAEHTVTVSVQGNSREKFRMAYTDFVKRMLQIILNEVHYTDDTLLTVAALSGLLQTDCTPEKITERFGAACSHAVLVLKQGEAETFPEYVRRVCTSAGDARLLVILLAGKLLELRLTLCPLETWKEDFKRYDEMEAGLDGIPAEYAASIPGVKWLLQSIRERIDENRKFSYECNKNAGELYSGSI